MITTEILIIFSLLLINAFFAMSEIAIVSASRPLLRQAAKQGNKRAELALRLAEDPGKFLSTVQVGITLVGIMAGAYGGATIAEKIAPSLNNFSFIFPHGNSVAVAIIVTCITYFSVVVGELVPKQFALRHAERIAMIVATPMSLLSAAVTPVVVVLQVSAALLLRGLGVTKDSEEQMTEEEVKAILSESAETGVIEKTEHEMLQRVIRLGDREIKSIMTHRQDVIFINVNSTLEEIRDRIHEAGHSRYPVIENGPDDVIGIIQAKDMLDDILNEQTFQVRSHLKEIYAIPENSTCLAALEHFKKSSINLMVVVDEYGSTQGIVTPSDLLEAIVGVLPSNYGEDHEAMIVMREDGSWLVDGRTPIEEIHLSIGLSEISADEDFDTIAGFVLEHLRKSPKTADAFEVFGHRFEILDMDGRRIDKVLIQPLNLSDRSDEN
jgi:putative hemolysin